MTVLAALAGVAAMATVSACSDDPAAPVAVASVDLTPVTATLRSGTTTALTATPRDAGGNALTGRAITYATSAWAVATVDAAGIVTGTGNGMANITATSEGITSAPAAITSWVGVTGTWAGSLTSGATTCPLTQSLTEDATSAVTGNGEVFGPCSVGTYTLAGTNNTGMVADSVDIFWTGAFALNFEGTFDGTDTMAGVITDTGCNGCTFTFTRSSFVPAIRMPLTAGHQPSAGGSILK